LDQWRSSDTVRIRITVLACPDIDDDNDGIPDYVEANMPAALQDADSDGILNFQDTDYPGFVDHNNDGIMIILTPVPIVIMMAFQF